MLEREETREREFDFKSVTGSLLMRQTQLCVCVCVCARARALELCDNVNGVSNHGPTTHKGKVSPLSVAGDLTLPFSSLLCNTRRDLRCICPFLALVLYSINKNTR